VARSDSVSRAVPAGDRFDRSLRGTPALGLPSIHGFGLVRRAHAVARPERMLRHGSRGRSAVEPTGIRPLDATDRLRAVPGSRDPDPLARSFADVATLLDQD